MLVIKYNICLKVIIWMVLLICIYVDYYVYMGFIMIKYLILELRKDVLL